MAPRGISAAEPTTEGDSMAAIPPTPSPVAVVTGGARGIGLAVARWFLAHGHRVALLDIEADTLRRTVAELGAPEAVQGLPCDVSHPAHLHHRIAALVNTAGIATFKPIAETGYEDWRRVMAVNLDGPFLCSQACVPHLMAAGGGA